MNNHEYIYLYYTHLCFTQKFSVFGADILVEMSNTLTHPEGSTSIKIVSLMLKNYDWFSTKHIFATFPQQVHFLEEHEEYFVR